MFSFQLTKVRIILLTPMGQPDDLCFYNKSPVSPGWLGMLLEKAILSGSYIIDVRSIHLWNIVRISMMYGPEP